VVFCSNPVECTVVFDQQCGTAVCPGTDFVYTYKGAEVSYFEPLVETVETFYTCMRIELASFCLRAANVLASVYQSRSSHSVLVGVLMKPCMEYFFLTANVLALVYQRTTPAHSVESVLMKLCLFSASVSFSLWVFLEVAKSAPSG
jgi:hypothetical protein